MNRVESKQAESVGGPALRVTVVGLGYVGLPLAIELAKKYEVTGFDIDPQRIAELKRGVDRTLEVESDDLKGGGRIAFTSSDEDISGSNVFIVTAPTPVDQHKKPDLTPVLAASKTIGRHLSEGDIVIFESTVYPGATEEECVPALEAASGLKFNKDFFVGYSPERINPGDRSHRLTGIRKVTSGSDAQTAEIVDNLYASIITAGTHRAPSIRVAEAAKVIENVQRDVNIALMNELAMLFNRLGIDTGDVLEAAGTKWNFLPFQPGLVGGHCIGVDPYYLTHKATEVGYHPEMILAGRRLNDGMGAYISSEIVKLVSRRGLSVHGGRVLVLGLTFKENTPDLRNTRVVDIVGDLRDYGLTVDVADPYADPESAKSQYGIQLVDLNEVSNYDCVVLAVAHDEYVSDGGASISKFGHSNAVVADLKRALDRSISDYRL